MINLTEPPQKQHDIKSLKNFILILFLMLKSVHSCLTIDLFQIFSVLAMGHRVDAVFASPIPVMVGPVWGEVKVEGKRGSIERSKELPAQSV